MKKALLIFSLVLVLLTQSGQTFQVSFSEAGADKLFDNTGGDLPVVSQGKLTLPSSIATRSFPVEPGKKYKLLITAEVVGDFVVEKNHRAHIMTLLSPLHQLSSTFSVIFENANGEEIRGLRNEPVIGFFATNQMQSYVSVFYIPAEARRLKVRFQSNGRETRIADLKLVEETEEKSINPNPDFRYGELSYSGWKPQRDGRLHTRPDGKTVLNSVRGASSGSFPLNPGSNYRIFAVGSGANGTVSITYFDKDGKNIITSFLLRPTKEGTSADFTPPAGTAMATLMIDNSAILEEVRVTELR